uniref:Ig-like domain-containing protein n=1 Tax=Lates calcarifer TaxID=8187 RepID=A0A4W6FR98_LATCA
AATSSLNICFFTQSDTSCQVDVEGFIGEDVLLSCIYNNSTSVLEKVFIYWLDGDNRVMLEIVQSAPDFGPQHYKFRGRVVTFPDLYRRGNFSIVLQNIQQVDDSTYHCHVEPVDFHQVIRLTVSETRPETSNKCPQFYLLFLLSKNKVLKCFLKMFM